MQAPRLLSWLQQPEPKLQEGLACAVRPFGLVDATALLRFGEGVFSSSLLSAICSLRQRVMGLASLAGLVDHLVTVLFCFLEPGMVGMEASA